MTRKRPVRWWLVCLPLYPALWGLWEALDRLEWDAETAEEPAAGVSRQFGRGGPAGLVPALMLLGSAPTEADSVARVVLRRFGPKWNGAFAVEASDHKFRHVTAFHGKRKAVVGRHAKGVELVEVQERLLKAKGTVQGGLLPSLHAAGVPEELQHDFVDAFRWSTDLIGDVRDDDRFSVVWTERGAGGKAVGYRLEAATLEGSEVGRHAGMLWDGEFYDRDGLALRRSYLKSPLRYRAISSAFGGFRFSPLGWPMRRHRGTDFAAPAGTPVISVADGTASYVGWMSEYGNLVKVRHPSSRETFYGHLSRFGPGLRNGAPVRQGRVLGYVGVTGNATGPHLHFELRRDGKTEDFREAELPGEAIGRASRPRRFAKRWTLLLGR